MQEKKYKPKKQTLIWNDIRSGHKPNMNRMLLILVGSDICIGGYEKLYSVERGNFFQFWDGDAQDPIAAEEVTAWAYLNAPDFEE
jgi:hypothetical protein